MIPIFRKIRKQMADDDQALKYMRYAIGEIALVVVGILIALQINNWNENRKERKIEKDYIFSLMEDAKTDVSNFTIAITENEQRVKNLDSFASMCFTYSVKEKKDADLLLQYFTCLRHPDFVTYTDRTMAQLKNTGGMRLITDKNMADAILAYEGYFEKLTNQQVWYEGGLKDLAEAGISIFNYKYLPTRDKEFDKELFYKTAQLNTTDKQLLIALGNRAKFYSAVTYFYLVLLKEGQQKSLDLIKVLENGTVTSQKK